MGKNSDKIPFNDYVKQLSACVNNNDPTVVYTEDFKKKLSKNQLKELIYANTYNRLLNIILKLYKWHLPPTYNERSIELGLTTRGYMCAYVGPVGTFCLPCTPNNMYNIYGDPSQVRVYGYNGYQDVVDIIYPYESPQPENTVLSLDPTLNMGIFMRDNDTAYPYINYVKEYAYKLTDKIIALNIACQRLKSPFTYIADDKALKDSIEKLVDKIESNDDVIIRIRPNPVANGVEPITLEQNNMNPAIIQHLKDAILFDFNMFLETLGINTNPSPDKAEVVLTPELNSNNSLIDLEKDVRFINRQKFCEQVSKILGIPMAVEVNVNDATQLIERTQRQMLGEGGFENEQQNSNAGK